VVTLELVGGFVSKGLLRGKTVLESARFLFRISPNYFRPQPRCEFQSSLEKCENVKGGLQLAMAVLALLSWRARVKAERLHPAYSLQAATYQPYTIHKNVEVPHGPQCFQIRLED
jgi:hypothetical protein